MNLDDLRAELDAQARDIDPHATGRMAGIRAKIAQRRRRKAGATVAASVLAVGAIIGVPVASHLSVGPEPAGGGGGAFPEKIDGDTKIAEATGEQGDTKVTLTFTPEDTDFLLKLDCDDLAPRDIEGEAARGDWYAVYTVKGKRAETRCGPGGTASIVGDVGGVASRDRVRKHWNRFGVEAGEPVEVSVTVIDALAGSRSSEQIKGMLGVAAYDMTGDRRKVLGVALPQERTVGGDTYELADDRFTVAPTKPRQSQSLSVLEPGRDTLVMYGGFGRYITPARGSIDGVRGGLPRTEGGIATQRIPARDLYRAKVQNLSDTRTKLVVAYYVPEE